MKYLLLMYSDESIAQKFTPEEYQAAGQAWYALGQLGRQPAIGICRWAGYIILQFDQSPH